MYTPPPPIREITKQTKMTICGVIWHRNKVALGHRCNNTKPPMLAFYRPHTAIYKAPQQVHLFQGRERFVFQNPFPLVSIKLAF